MHRMITDLRAPEAELRETHISWVLLLADRVIKVKKPVDFGFLDFSTREKRLLACETEVALNRRLAPDVYLGVADIVRDDSGHHALTEEKDPRGGGAGDNAQEGARSSPTESDGLESRASAEVVDHAVIMRRLPDADRADLRLAREALDEGHLRTAAEVLARFHREAEGGEKVRENGRRDRVAVSVLENFEQTRGRLSRFLSPEEAAELEAWQMGFLEENAARFEARVEAGRVRDGHGDLRLEHLYFDEDGGLRVLDGIEFSERLRYGDVCGDVAFLAMDLGMHGRVDLAEQFLALYARAAQDYDLYGLVDFYESYRAFVRGKVACFRLDDPELPSKEASATEHEARRYFRLALASERRSLLAPTLVAVGGLIASGKSTIAEALCRQLGAPVLDTDRTRKSLLDVAPTARLSESGFEGAYDPGFSEKVYDEVLRRARVVLESGRPVVVDATFRSAALRRRFRDLSRALGVGFRFVECRVSRATALQRLERRARDPDAVSDGRVEIWDDFAERFEPVDELSEEEHLIIDTERPLGEVLTSLRDHIPTWPAGLVD